MEEPYVILIADRNPRIRDFIQREFKSEGYHVFTAESAGQLEYWIDRSSRLDALVMDPDLPGLESPDHLGGLLSRRPTLQVVFHCLAVDQPQSLLLTLATAWMMSNGKSGVFFVVLKPVGHYPATVHRTSPLGRGRVTGSFTACKKARHPGCLPTGTYLQNLPYSY